MKIKERMDQLYRADKATLKEIVKRSYRVIDLRECDKHTLVGLVLEAEYGHQYFAKMEKEQGVRP